MIIKSRSIVVQSLFITFTAVTLRLYPHTFSQMNEIKLNEFMIFVAVLFTTKHNFPKVERE